MDPFLNAANRLYEVLIGNLNCIGNWGVYLYDRKFDSEPELRNKIGVIWLCSLLDTHEAFFRHLPDIVTEAKENNWPSLIHNALQIRHFCYATEQLLNLFTREEQIFLVDFRNQLVHSYLRGRHNKKIRVKYCLNHELKVENLTWREYSTIVANFTKKASCDEVISPLITKSLDTNLNYWKMVDYFNAHHNKMYKIIVEGNTFTIFPG